MCRFGVKNLLKKRDLTAPIYLSQAEVYRWRWMQLTEEEKIAFIAEKCAEVTDEKDLVVMKKVWPDVLRDYTGTTRFKDLIEIVTYIKW